MATHQEKIDAIKAARARVSDPFEPGDLLVWDRTFRTVLGDSRYTWIAVRGYGQNLWTVASNYGDFEPRKYPNLGALADDLWDRAEDIRYVPSAAAQAQEEEDADG